MKKLRKRSVALTEPVNDPAEKLSLRIKQVLDAHCRFDSTAPGSAQEQLQKAALKGCATDFLLFSAIEKLCLDVFNNEEEKTAHYAAEILLGCVSQYYECLGSFEKSLNIEVKVLEWATEISDLPIKRRAHNCMGVRYARFCDFGKACEHLDQACELANKMGKPSLVFASLVNAVALMQSMGLLASARRLALQLISQPKEDECFNHLHLINANNGMLVCHELDDFQNAEIFYRIAKTAIGTCPSLISNLNIAYFESGRIVHLLRQGNYLQAMQFAEDALSKNSQSENLRIKTLFLCAQSEVRLVLNIKNDIENSCSTLEQLLEPCKAISTHYETILRLLVRLYSAKCMRGQFNNKSKSVFYLRCLREHLISVKHRIFFAEEFSKLSSTIEKSLKLANPFYNIPEWLIGSKERSDVPDQNLGIQQFDQDCSINSLPYDLAKLSGGCSEARLRCDEFDVAENWSVAAEMALGSDGRHCFRVGRLVALIALKLGFSRLHAVRLDLACRLHDIGNIATVLSYADANELRPRGKFSLFCQHAPMGRKLLEGSPNSTMKLASLIAQNHHEWWNGCGFPVGLKGECIPIEARLCTVADVFLGLITSNSLIPAFSLAQAQNQLIALADTQLDPTIVSVLIELFYIDDGSVASERSMSYSQTEGRAKGTRNRIYDVLDLSH